MTCLRQALRTFIMLAHQGSGIMQCPMGLSTTICVKLLRLYLQEYDYLEFFAGKANASRCMAVMGLAVCSLDINYYQKREGHGSNYMDLLDPSGFWFSGPI